MSLFSGILGSILPLVLAPLTGGASLLIQTALKAVLSAVGSQIIQKLGEALGLPQQIIDMGKAAFAAATGQSPNAISSVPQAVEQLGEALGFSPSQQGEMTRDIEDQINNMIQDAIKNNTGFDDENGGKVKGKGGKGDFFTRMAEMLGKKLNDSFDQLDKAADATDFKDAKSATDFQALQQKFSYFMTSITAAIKTVGEALTTASRKG